MITASGAMRVAIDEAKKGLGYVSPNPPVGCAIIDSEGHMLAKGYHKNFGGPHAEIDALSKVTDQSKLKGATIYVTLEPCAHEGKTPSCAKRLATLPIKKVVYGLQDPNPLVNGAGRDILRAAGIEVEQSVSCEGELEDLAEIFLVQHRKKKAFVALKCATTLDGHIATKSGESKWITGEKARAHTHYLRALYSAVAIGANTLLVDDPKLNIRHEKFPQKSNKVIVFDSPQLNLEKVRQSSAYILHQDEFYVATLTSQKWSGLNIKVLPCHANADSKIDLPDFAKVCLEHGIYSVMVEGGAQIVSSFLKQGYVDRVHQYIAPKYLGALNGLNLTASLSVASLSAAPTLTRVKSELMGDDVYVTGRFAT